MASRSRGDGPAIHMPTFNFLEERAKLKTMAKEMMRKAEKQMDQEDIEEGDDEMMEGEEEMMEGDEEMIDDDEGEILEEDEMDLEGMEEGDEEEMGEEGDEEEMGEEDEENEGEQTVNMKGKKLEQGKDNNKKVAKKKDDEAEINSSFYDDSESEDAKPIDPRSYFLSTSSIYDRDKNKRRQTREDIKKGKQENREEHLKKKLGHKLKERGRLTNQAKKKNNPYQMFIQKKRLQNRLLDLKKASRNTKKKQKGQSPRNLGKSFGRKVKK